MISKHLRFMFEDAIIRTVLVGMAGLGLGAIHGWFYRPATVDAFGWRWLKPGFMHHLLVLGMSAVALLLWGAFLLVASVPQNTAIQVAGMAALTVAMTAGALIAVWRVYLRQIGWRRTVLRVRAIGKETTYDLEEVSNINFRHSGETVVLRFRDRRKISFSADMYGADELVDHIYQLVF